MVERPRATPSFLDTFSGDPANRPAGESREKIEQDKQMARVMAWLTGMELPDEEEEGPARETDRKALSLDTQGDYNPPATPEDLVEALVSQYRDLIMSMLSGRKDK